MFEIEYSPVASLYDRHDEQPPGCDRVSVGILLSLSALLLLLLGSFIRRRRRLASGKPLRPAFYRLRLIMRRRGKPMT
ncbi:hypothetical protein [Luethyella okanaganae]|uniref:LPXTG cell wall anchor domain-containing protein n=1 Tax=Luethyella okanaganae TaxID=69372 RepID=A0ABW1VCV7_9MICO